MFVEEETLRLYGGVARRGPGPTAVSPVASSLDSIFIRIGNGLNGPTDTMPGSLDCAAWGFEPPGYSDHTIYIPR